MPVLAPFAPAPPDCHQQLVAALAALSRVAALAASPQPVSKSALRAALGPYKP